MTSFFMTRLLWQVYVCMHNSFFMTSLSVTSLSVVVRRQVFTLPIFSMTSVLVGKLKKLTC